MFDDMESEASLILKGAGFEDVLTFNRPSIAGAEGQEFVRFECSLGEKTRHIPPDRFLGSQDKKVGFLITNLSRNEFSIADILNL